MASGASTTADLGGMRLQGVGGRHVLMDEGKMVALSSIVVVSTTVGPAKAYALISPEDGATEDGGGGF